MLGKQVYFRLKNKNYLFWISFHLGIKYFQSVPDINLGEASGAGANVVICMSRTLVSTSTVESR